MEGSAAGPPAAGVQGFPVALTSFVGRRTALRAVGDLLAEYRLVTVTGPGGSGKSRLVIAAAGRLQEWFGEAIAFVPLADLTDAAQIPEALASALELPRSPEVERLEQ
ncbi:MAG TPA: hypothetical protein VGQ05_24710, partial [Streptosporangiaceae bacterium]|nr:hypothetical protein [Streptosporangiaceae bacterium]